MSLQFRKHFRSAATFSQNISCFFVLACFISSRAQAQNGNEKIALHGLHQPVEVIRDSFGINHIYAKDQHDLFFAQGYCAAKDRLFQYEIWRRQATGTVAEILGPRELKRDIGTRLFMYRGNLENEYARYHPQGKEIIGAFVEGVNTRIEEVLQHRELLPPEFELLHLLPEKWTPEVVISRHQGLLGNSTEELNYGMAVALAGSKKVKELAWFHPKDPVIDLDAAINGKLLGPQVLEIYNAYRKELVFDSAAISPENRAVAQAEKNTELQHHPLPEGSNNWIVAGSRTYNGYTMMANDPHRRISVPSLRYMVHLQAPGWNVIGGGEPEIPGVSIGHNESGAWGLTIFETDGEDIYVYDLNPANLHQYKYKGEWKDMQKITEQFAVKGSGTVSVDLYYTQHGPVTYLDSTNAKGYALRCAWLEPGGSPYLASLRIDQADSWTAFREACNYANIPGENMIWADKQGKIGWQAVGIAPIRKNFSGLVPVPGDGRYEWSGYLPISEKPHLLNPAKGYFATANQQVTPPDYAHWDAIGYSWADDFRGNRINSVLSAKKKITLEDFEKLQTDHYSIPASELVPLLKNFSFAEPDQQQAAKLLATWDFVLDKNSVAAGIYISWEREMQKAAELKFVPENLRKYISLSWQKTISWILHPGNPFGNNPVEARNKFLKDCFASGIKALKEKLGSELAEWKYGQEKYKHVYIPHPLGTIVNEKWKNLLNAGPLPRGGNGDTPGSTGDQDNQTSGASFRIIVNTGDWDAARGINTPGQSGDPLSELYKNLFFRWANDKYFPVYFSKNKINSIRKASLELVPAQ